MCKITTNDPRWPTGLVGWQSNPRVRTFEYRDSAQPSAGRSLSALAKIASRLFLQEIFALRGVRAFDCITRLLVGVGHSSYSEYFHFAILKPVEPNFPISNGKTLSTDTTDASSLLSQQ